MTAALYLREDHAAILLGVLRQHLPAGMRVFVFGSRAHGGRVAIPISISRSSGTGRLAWT